MKRGTVLITGNFELPDLNAAAHRVVNNGKLFRELGYRPVFLGVRRGTAYFTGISRCENGSGFDMFEQAYPQTAGQWAAQMIGVKNIAEVAGVYPDLCAVMLYNAPFSLLSAVKRAFRDTDVRVLYDCTEWNAYTEGSFLKRAVKSADSRLIERRLDGRCHGLIVVSSAMEAHYRKTPLLRLPPLVDTEDPIWRQPKLQRERFEFCYAGAPSDKERLDLVAGAFGRLPAGSAALRFIGVTKADFAAAYPALRGFADRTDMIFTGRLSHAETVREILSCGCFIFIREETRRNTAGFPTKFAEAFTCGVPVITTAVSDVPAYADGACRVLARVSEDGILDAMREALSGNTPARALRTAFDYRSYLDPCRKWFETIV